MKIEKLETKVSAAITMKQMLADLKAGKIPPEGLHAMASFRLQVEVVGDAEAIQAIVSHLNGLAKPKG